MLLTLVYWGYKNHVDVEKNFEFQHITSDKIEKNIDKINIKKPLGLITFQPKISNSVNQ
jgi:hypothetical protein